MHARRGRQRTILVMIQNNAELRTGGGITGSFVDAPRGRVDGSPLVEQADSGEFPPDCAAPSPRCPASIIDALWRPSRRFVQNASHAVGLQLSTAELAAAWWAHAIRWWCPMSWSPSICPFLAGAPWQSRARSQLPNGSELTERQPRPAAARRRLPELSIATQQTCLPAGGDSHLLLDVFSAWPRHFRVGSNRSRSPAEQGRISLWSSASRTTRRSSADVPSPARTPATRRRGTGRLRGVLSTMSRAGKMGHLPRCRASRRARAQCRADGRRDVVDRASTLSNSRPPMPTAVPAAERHGRRACWRSADGDIGTIVTVAAPAGAVLRRCVERRPRRCRRPTSRTTGFPRVPARGSTLSPGEVERRWSSASSPLSREPSTRRSFTRPCSRSSPIGRRRSAVCRLTVTPSRRSRRSADRAGSRAGSRRTAAPRRTPRHPRTACAASSA